MTVAEVCKKASALGNNLVEITGGEPMLQQDTPALASALLKAGHTVLIETNGSIGLKDVPKRAIKIMDIKCPASGEAGSFLTENLKYLTKRDQVKFVVATMADYAYARKIINKHGLSERFSVIVSPVLAGGQALPADLALAKQVAAMIIRDRLNVRLQVQLHKLVEIR